MVGWHHQPDGHEFEQALGVGDGQGSLACCSPWGHKESAPLSNWATTDPSVGPPYWPSSHFLLCFPLLLLLQPRSTFCCSSKLPSHGWLKASACCAFYFKINFYQSVVVLQCCVNSAIQQSKSTVCTHTSPLYAPWFSWNALLPVISTPSPCSPLLSAIFSMIPSLTHYSKMTTTFPEFLIHLLCFIFPPDHESP